MKGFFKSVAAALLGCALLSDAHSVKRNPLSYVTRVDKPVLHSPSNRVNAYSSFDVTFTLHQDQQKIRLSLEPNHDVISDSFSITHLDQDGNVARKEKVNRADHRVYKGSAFVQHLGHREWINAGFARVTVSRDGPRPIFHGVFRIDGNHHHIATSSSYKQTQLEGDPDIGIEDDDFMVVWRDSDITKDPFDLQSELKRGLGSRSSCSSDQLDFNNLDEHPVHLGLDLRDMSAVSPRSLFGRQTDGITGGNGAGVSLAGSIGSTAGCPTTRKVAVIGIATDCTYRSQFGSESDMRDNVIQLVNSASTLYEQTFNITIGLQNLSVQPPDCPGSPPASTPWNVPCSGDVDITDRLNLFSQWRGSQSDTNAFWTLLTTCNTDTAVGLAWLGQLCSQGSQPQGGAADSNETIASANVVVRTDGTEWQVFAHEVGHTFGAFHDCTSQTCADGTSSMQRCCPLSQNACNARGDFIMNPSTSRDIAGFSPCSVGNICSAMLRNSVNSECLTDNRNVVTITGQQCGNGIVEEGEECDCGGEEGCGDNNCCEPKTCKFRTGAQCDPANEDCCTDSCKFASSGAICRASTGVCDPEETCSGTEAKCPDDVKANDGTACGDGGGLQCASGQCTSRDQQCRSLVGTLTSNNATAACNSQGCIVSCSSPRLGPNACYNMQQYFLDGTPCDGAGSCMNGICQGSNFVNQAGVWFSDNLHIVIPVAATIGGLLFLAILSCIWSSCRRRRRQKKAKAKKAATAAAAPGRSWGGGNNNNNTWAASNIPYPPQAMTGAREREIPMGWNSQPPPAWAPRRTSTARYA